MVTFFTFFVAPSWRDMLMKKGAFDTGDGTMRVVKVAIGEPITAKKEGREGPRVNDLRERTYASVVALHASIGGQPPVRMASRSSACSPSSGVRLSIPR